VKFLSGFFIVIIILSVFSGISYADMGSISGRVVVPGGNPEGVVLFFFSDSKMEYMVDGLVIYSPDGNFKIELPPGVYYIQAQLDVNKNGQTDAGDMIFTYGGETPLAVCPGSNIVFQLGGEGEKPLTTSASLSDIPAGSDGNSYSPPADSSASGNIKGKVIVPGHSSEGVVLLIFSDKTFETLVTASEVTSPDGSFSIVTGKGKYYLQAFFDANGNGQIDQGDISVCYGGAEPEPVDFDEEITLVFEGEGLVSAGPPAEGTPTPMSPVTTPTPAGNFKVRVVYPDMSPVGTTVQIASDTVFQNIVNQVNIGVDSGAVSFDLPAGEYYVRAFDDRNSNSLIDSGEFSAVYLKPVATGNREVILILEPPANISQIPDIPSSNNNGAGTNPLSLPPDLSSTPVESSVNNNGTYSLPSDIGMNGITPKPTENPSDQNNMDSNSEKDKIKGKVLFHGKKYSKIDIFVFSDPEFIDFITHIPVTEEGTFEKEMPLKDYYLQAFVDVNENQILETDDIIITYTAPDNPVPKIARPGGEDITIIISEKAQDTDVSQPEDPDNPGVISPSTKEYTIKGRVVWPDHALSKGVVEAYSDSTFRTLKGRAVIDEAGGNFTLKVPKGKYFLTVVMDDNMDGQLSLGDGIGVYGMKSIAESKGEMEPVIINGEENTVYVDVEITDFMDHKGEIVSLENYNPEEYATTSQISENLREYADKISSYKEILKKIKLSGKVYFSSEGNICSFDFTTGRCHILARGELPSASIFSNKLVYLGPGGEILLSATEGGDRELLVQAGDKMIQNISLSSGGNFLAYQVGTEITIIDLVNRTEQKKVFTTDMKSSPFQLSWLPGEKQVACLHGAGRTDIQSAFAIDTVPVTSATQKVPLDNILPFDGFTLTQTGSTPESNGQNSATDGLFPVVMTGMKEGSQKGPGAYIWNRESMESYFVDFKEAGSISDIVWSPTNPNLFLFTTGIPSQIWLGRLSDKGVEKSQVSIYGGYSPAWSPDGKNIVYINNQQLWIINIDSGMETPLLEGVLPVYGENPCWCQQ